MAKRKVRLTETQKRKNEEILAHLENERRKLVEDTRSLQEQSRRRTESSRSHLKQFG